MLSESSYVEHFVHCPPGEGCNQADPSRQDGEFYSLYFIVHILRCICPQDWFAAIDLKVHTFMSSFLHATISFCGLHLKVELGSTKPFLRALSVSMVLHQAHGGCSSTAIYGGFWSTKKRANSPLCKGFLFSG